ncbi:hypothetical protein COM05_28320 [Bacillus toyonensis]|uniref:hypothetical protein n=1 Tax=Bacillus cereus group TaxID=86661 RepID=UPI000BF07800|nr:hypothetical protein [Bacillus toyonensis]PEK30258.1 hypothetical protein CN897_28115 [Bacillus toyonensis]PEL72587.1 hypothetical protein CN603_23610 [Bacillus toyonensis]PGB76847.1 hypothetical protein COM05_28320 [Bacillus toyonensis]
MINIYVIDNLFPLILKYPIRIILILAGLGLILKCIKQGLFLSAVLMVSALALLIIVTFTNILTSVLTDVPLTVQYVSLVIFTIIYCFIFDYELSRN